MRPPSRWVPVLLALPVLPVLPVLLWVLVASLHCATSPTAADRAPAGRPPLQPPPDSMFCPGDPSYGIGLPPPKRTPGMLSEAEVAAYLKGKDPLLQDCYQDRIKRGYDIEGKVGLRFEVSPEGFVQRLCLVEDQTGDGVFLGCLLGELGTWQWPKKPERTEVRKRWNFSHGG
jgi:hypothetical protein